MKLILLAIGLLIGLFTTVLSPKKIEKSSITGKVQYINPAVQDEPYIIVDGVECSLKTPFEKPLAIGQEITVTGEMHDKFMSGCEVK